MSNSKWKLRKPRVTIWFWILVVAFVVFLLVQYLIRPMIVG